MIANRRMRALQLHGPGELSCRELPVPLPKPAEILVRTAATTICTSDIQDINDGRFQSGAPRVLGHEAAGVVEKVGETVTGFAVGDMVAAHPVVPCGRCDQCREGLAHLCSRMGHLGIDRDGTFAEYFTIRSDRCRHVPRGMDPAVSALLEPVSVCIEALARTRLSEDESVVVIGDGPFGVVVSRLAAAVPAARSIIVGRHPKRMELARSACRIRERGVEATTAQVLTHVPGGAHVCIHAVGSAAALQTCINVVRPRGRIAAFCYFPEPIPVDVGSIHMKELELLGCCNDEDFLDQSMSALSDPRMAFGEIVTHRLPFEQWERAFELATSAKDDTLKVALCFE